MPEKKSLEEYEQKKSRIYKIRKIIENIQLVFTYEQGNGRCPFCDSKINIDKMRKRSKKYMKLNNKFDSCYQYVDIKEV